MAPLSFHTHKFSEKVRQMNDAHKHSLTLSADEARALHADIFALLAKITALTDIVEPPTPTVVTMTGGKF